MKILFCVNSLGGFGGIERVTIVKANALAAIEGNEVGICYTDKGAYPETIHPLSLSVKVFGLNTPYWGFTSLSTIAKGFIPMVYRTRKALLKLIKSFRPDVIITTGSYEKFALASIGLTRAMVRSSSATVGNTLIIREYHFNSNYRQYLGGSKITMIR